MSNTSLYLATVFMWGTSWYAVRLQLTDVSPDVSIFYRFFLSTLIMFAVCFIRQKPLRYSTTQHIHFMMMGFFLFNLNFYLIYHSSLYLSTGVVSIVFCIVQIFNMINSRLILGDRISFKMLCGALVGIAGITLVFLPEIQLLDLSDKAITGLTLALLGTFSASIGMTTSAVIQRKQWPVLQSNSWGMLYGSTFMLGIILFRGSPFTIDTSPTYIGSLLFLVIFASVLAFYCFLSLIGRIGAAKASYATVMFPIIALAISTWLEGYEWNPMATLGVVLALGGNVLIIQDKHQLSNS